MQTAKSRAGVGEAMTFWQDGINSVAEIHICAEGETMDRIEAMRLFVAVVDQGGFSHAARHEGVSPAHVSKKVAKLEERLGVRLLERTTRAVSLTPAGAAYLERVKAILADLDGLEEELAAAQTRAAGLVRLTAPVDFGARRLTPVVLSFLDAHPQVEVRLALTDRYVDLVDEGFDLAVRIGRLSDSSLIARRLSASGLMLAAHPDHPAVAGAREPQDLTRYDCIIDSNVAQPRRWRLARDGETAEVRVSGRLTVNSPEAVRLAVLAGHGVALAPAFAVEQDVAAGRLAAVLADWTPEPRDIWVVFPQNRYLSTRVRLFVEHVAGAFRTPADGAARREG